MLHFSSSFLREELHNQKFILLHVDVFFQLFCLTIPCQWVTCDTSLICVNKVVFITKPYHDVHHHGPGLDNQFHAESFPVII